MSWYFWASVGVNVLLISVTVMVIRLCIRDFGMYEAEIRKLKAELKKADVTPPSLPTAEPKMPRTRKTAAHKKCEEQLEQLKASYRTLRTNYKVLEAELETYNYKNARRDAEVVSALISETNHKQREAVEEKKKLEQEREEVKKMQKGLVPIPPRREPVSAKKREQVLRRDSYTCRYCGDRVTASDAHIDHVYPVKHGGKSMLGNLVTACQPCNLKKSAVVGMWPKPVELFIGAGAD